MTWGGYCLTLYPCAQYACNEVPLSELTASGGGSGGWSKFDVYLGNFNSSGPSSVQQVCTYYERLAMLETRGAEGEIGGVSSQQQTTCVELRAVLRPAAGPVAHGSKRVPLRTAALESSPASLLLILEI